MKASMQYFEGAELRTDPLEGDSITATGGENGTPAVVRVFSQLGHFPVRDIVYYRPVRFEKTWDWAALEADVRQRLLAELELAGRLLPEGSR